MPKLSIHIDETFPARPTAVLRIASVGEIHLDDRELDALIMEILWAKDCISEARGFHFQQLATKYKGG
jgi:hypothetical protein